MLRYYIYFLFVESIIVIIYNLGNSENLQSIPVGTVFRRSELVFEVVYFNGSSSVWPGYYIHKSLIHGVINVSLVGKNL